MSRALDLLLGELPNVYDTDAHPEPAIRVITPNVTVAVRSGAIVINGTPVPLTGSMGDVLGAFQSAGVEVVLERRDLSNRSARLLLDVPTFTTSATDPSMNFLYVFNNTLWILLRPLASALEAREASYADALRALNLLTATGFWADVWGRFLGIPRRGSELDANYTARMKHEVVRRRLNNRALEQILLDELGVDARVENLLPLVLTWNETVWHSFWAGNVYNSGAFVVSYAEGAGVSSTDILRLVDKHRAAGTRFILRAEQQVRAQVTVSARATLGGEPVWDGRVSGLILRAQADAASEFLPLVTQPGAICPETFIAWGSSPETIFDLASGDFRARIPVGAPAYVSTGSGPKWTRIVGVSLSGGNTRVTLSIPIPAGRDNVYLARAPRPPVEIPVGRQPRWVPGQTAMPGSVMAY